MTAPEQLLLIEVPFCARGPARAPRRRPTPRVGEASLPLDFRPPSERMRQKSLNSDLKKGDEGPILNPEERVFLLPRHLDTGGRARLREELQETLKLTPRRETLQRREGALKLEVRFEKQIIRALIEGPARRERWMNRLQRWAQENALVEPE